MAAKAKSVSTPKVEPHVIHKIKTSEWFPPHLMSFIPEESDFTRGISQRHYIKLSLKEKRKLYTCGKSFVTLDEIPTWAKESREYDTIEREKHDPSEYLPNSTINEKVSLWLGDITKLEIDAVVNATCPGLAAAPLAAVTGTVHDALHKAAGPLLMEESKLLGKCETGEAKVTFGYNLPAKLVIHSMQGNGFVHERLLLDSYESCLEIVSTYNIKSVAFCCIGTGNLGFSGKTAAQIALKTTRKWLEDNSEKVERIIFCVYKQSDWDLYDHLLRHYFPLHLLPVHQGVKSRQFNRGELEMEKERSRKMEKLVEKEKERAEAIEQHLKSETEKMKRLREEKEGEINRLSEVVHQQENRIQELEQRVAESCEREVRLEQQLHQNELQLEQRVAESREREVRLEQQLRQNELQLEQRVAESREREVRLEQQLRQNELQLANSDRVFQDIFQRLLGQLPQSQPHWVVRRGEIELTEEQLGVGGWATVKVALFRGQHVAAKCLHNQIISAHNIRLFTREMNMAARSRHPNLLQFIGATMDNNPIILTELMPTSLRRILEEGNPLSHRLIVSIASDVARALNYLHLTTPDPIIHRDVSSANVLLKHSSGDSYEAKLSDYGSANFVRYSTTVGPGNPLYSAPEVNDPKQHSPKMDVYSFGVLLVEMCSGELFDDIEELIHTRVREWPEMVEVIRSCTRQDPQRRPNAADIIRQLELMR